MHETINVFLTQWLGDSTILMYSGETPSPMEWLLNPVNKEKYKRNVFVSYPLLSFFVQFFWDILGQGITPTSQRGIKIKWPNNGVRYQIATQLSPLSLTFSRNPTMSRLDDIFNHIGCTLRRRWAALRLPDIHVNVFICPFFFIIPRAHSIIGTVVIFKVPHFFFQFLFRGLYIYLFYYTLLTDMSLFVVTYISIRRHILLLLSLIIQSGLLVSIFLLVRH